MKESRQEGMYTESGDDLWENWMAEKMLVRSFALQTASRAPGGSLRCSVFFFLSYFITRTSPLFRNCVHVAFLNGFIVRTDELRSSPADHKFYIICSSFFAKLFHHFNRAASLCCLALWTLLSLNLFFCYVLKYNENNSKYIIFN